LSLGIQFVAGGPATLGRRAVDARLRSSSIVWQTKPAPGADAAPRLKSEGQDGRHRCGPKIPPTSLTGYWPAVRSASGSARIGQSPSSKITKGALAEDHGAPIWLSCGDYDNNGFLDLFVANTGGQVNFLYRNNGNSNNWVVFKLVGTASNRAAIGAKVRIKATIGGKTFWQMREISGGNGCQNDLRAHFGLGDSTNVTTLRIEWPSGVVQEFTDVAAKQFLTIWEPPALRGAMLADGSCQLNITAEPNRAWQIQASTDLKTWQALTTVTPATAVSQYTDANAVGMACRFYHVRPDEP
jgi:hypothetical protein